MAVIGRGLSGSEMKTYHALSPMHNATLGSSNAVNLGDYTFLNMIVSAGCVNNLTVTLKRSATSAGTFSECASVNLATGSALAMVGVSLRNSSAIWYRADYTQAGSANFSIIMQAQGGRKSPVDQESTTTVYSTILG